MKKITILLMALASLTISSSQGQDARVDLGVYDAAHTFDTSSGITYEQTSPGITYEQMWISWADYAPGKLLPQLQAITAKGRTPILSIDPYSIKSVGSDSRLLSDIVSGKYDAVTKAMATEVASLGSPVFIRWGPEMERDITKPWSKKPAANYIAAFRHFVTAFKAISPTSSMIWSPIGNEGSAKYYPGSDAVDYVGFSVCEYPICTIGWYGQPRSFAEWMDKKYPPLAIFGKPIIIVELGICDTPINQKAWIQAAFASVGTFPLVRALIYYNAVDPVSWKPWGGTGKPDWTIDPSNFVE
jgi:beta-mannanase